MIIRKPTIVLTVVLICGEREERREEVEGKRKRAGFLQLRVGPESLHLRHIR